MFSLSFIELQQYFNDFLWPMFRVAGFFMSAPIFGARLVPARVRLMLTLAVSFVLFKSIPNVPDIDPLSIQGVVTVAYQIAIGFTMGFVLQILFHVGAMGGQIIAMKNGLGFATMMDPINGTNVATLSQFFIISSNLMFLALNGHLYVFKLLLESFTSLPIGPEMFPAVRFYDLVASATWLFQGSLLIAMPAIVALLTVNVAFGVMARVAPTLNIFAIGFPLTLTMGIIILYIVFGGFGVQFEMYVDKFSEFLVYMISPS